MQAWSRPAANSSSLCIKLELVMPNLDLETVWKVTKEMKTRAEWDPSIVDLEIIEDF